MPPQTPHISVEQSFVCCYIYNCHFILYTCSYNSFLFNPR